MEIITRPDETETKMVVISGGTLMKFLRRLAWVATFIREMTRQDGGSRLVLFEEENQSRSLCPSAVCFARVTSVQTIPNIISLNIERTRPNPAFVFFCQSDRFGTVPIPSSLLCRQFFNNNSNNNNRINFSRIFSVLSFINLLYRRSYLVGSVIITPIYTRVNSPVCEKLSSKSF